MSRERSLRLAGRLFRFCALMCLFTAVLALTFATPATIKQAARDSKIYEAASTYTKSTALGVNINPVVKAGLDNAASSTFTPEYVQSSAEQFIDGTYRWLDGSADKPDFKIDATPAVNQFLAKAGDSAAGYAQNLPACPAGTPLPNLNGTDLADLKCLPRGVNIATVRDETINRLRASNDFLANPVLTADTLPNLAQSTTGGLAANPNGTNNVPVTNNEEPLYKKFSQLPTYYQVARALPWVFGALSLLAAIWIFALYRDPRKATYGIARSLLWVSLPVTIVATLGHFLFNAAAEQGGGIARAVDGTFQQYSVAFVRSIENSLAYNLIIVSGSIAAVSGLVTLIMFFANRSKKPGSDHGYTEAMARLADKDPSAPTTKPAETPPNLAGLTPRPADQAPTAPQLPAQPPSSPPPSTPTPNRQITHSFNSPPSPPEAKPPQKIQ